MKAVHEHAQESLMRRLRARRLDLNLTQEGLAQRSGVAFATVKHFERTGLISLVSLLKLAVVLDCLNDFNHVCPPRERDLAASTLDQILAQPKRRQRGRRH
ncbi:MAG: helix-turn-helix domain-containing protein [Bryobacterales bacterium]|nr:helix-turn-helix domain-containing protein [Bryobacterales bacterium]